MIHENNDIILIERHKIKFMYIYGKFFILFCLTVLLLLTISNFKNSFLSGENFILYWSVIFILLLLVNLIVAILVIDLITYYNSIILVSEKSIVIMQNTLLIREDIEIIDLSQLTKVNVECRGLLSNLFGYGKLVIEQQGGDIRPLFFIPEPYRIINYIKKRMGNRPIELLDNNSSII